MERHTVLVVDDHPLLRRGVRELLSRDEAIALARRLEPDLIVLDLNMRGSSGVEILSILKEEDPSRRIVILTVSDSGEAPRAEQAPSLTDREEDVLGFLALGMTNKMIARRLGISDGTVKGHVKHLLKKLGFSSRVEAAVWHAQREESRARR